jgi:asparagine synthase (glutamine-hydrolysing)
VAEHLGTEHTELYVSPEEAVAVVPRLPAIYDEPFADSSQIPTFLVSRLARTDVTVALSGDGGDELFGGYDRYFVTRQVWHSIRWMPPRARSAVASILRSPLVGSAASLVQPLMPQPLRFSNVPDKLLKLSDVLAVHSREDLYDRIVSAWKDPLAVVIGSTRRPSIANVISGSPVKGFTDRMMAVDAATYMPDDILVKVDRASMAVSLECRAPLLDFRVYEFAWRLPLAMKVRGTTGKWILRQLLSRYVPHALFARPKMGFGVPLAEWLRGPLREWAEALLDSRRIEGEGFLAAEPIRRKWDEHLRRENNWQYYLWPVLMFQAWLEHSREQQVRRQSRSVVRPALAVARAAGR